MREKGTFYSATAFIDKEKDGWHIWNPEWTESFGPFKTRELARQYARKNGFIFHPHKKGKMKTA